MAKQLRSEKRFFLLKCGLVAASLAGVGLLTGCDSGPGSSSSSAVKMEARISGSVSDHRGPIDEGKIEVKDRSGAVVATTQFTGGKYSISIPSSASYPIMMTAYPAAAGAVASDPVKAAVTSPIADRMDISAVTTNVVDGAMTLGGLTEENIAKASGGAIGMRQAQGVSAGAGGSGGGPGNSGGGAGRGGHAGHSMSDMNKSSSGDTETK